MDKYIFLDCDGVIATPERVVDGRWSLVDSKQFLLGQIIKQTDAKIVLSSSWREDTLEETKNKMQEAGFWFTDLIIGITIRAKRFLDPEKKVHLSIPRGVEIKQWLDINCVCPWIGNPERKEEFSVYTTDGKFVKMRSQELYKDYNYVILDDNGGMLLEQRHHFIQTRHTGLTGEDTIKAIAILNQEN